MVRPQKTTKRHKPKAILRFPDLEQSKNAVVNSLAAASSQESYGHAIDEFIGWYCSEPRLAFNRTVVLRYRFFLEQKNLAPSTINVRLAAVRRLAYEASDSGLLSPELAAGIRRVKGAKRLSFEPFFAIACLRLTYYMRAKIAGVELDAGNLIYDWDKIWDEVSADAEFAAGENVESLKESAHTLASKHLRRNRAGKSGRSRSRLR
jgi:hypothetical protein